MPFARNEPTTKRLIGVVELARKIGCHPNSIPRFVKYKAGFPQPRMLFGKNTWDEGVIDKYIENLMADAGAA
jgi:predicted DNA-binding transcriptional regulator AlpA